MIEEFKGITEEEFHRLKMAISQITILIAGADGSITDSEKDWAEKITKIRSYALPRRLATFYKEVGLSFRDHIDEMAQEFIENPKDTTRMLKFELANLNDVLEKLEDRQIAHELYLSFLSFARHVARSTGGILGWSSIGPKEDELIGLSMIHPILPPLED